MRAGIAILAILVALLAAATVLLTREVSRERRAQELQDCGQSGGMFGMKRCLVDRYGWDEGEALHVQLQTWSYAR